MATPAEILALTNARNQRQAAYNAVRSAPWVSFDHILPQIEALDVADRALLVALGELPPANQNATLRPAR